MSKGRAKSEPLYEWRAAFWAGLDGDKVWLERLLRQARRMGVLGLEGSMLEQWERGRMAALRNAKRRKGAKP